MYCDDYEDSQISEMVRDLSVAYRDKSIWIVNEGRELEKEISVFQTILQKQLHFEGRLNRTGIAQKMDGKTVFFIADRRFKEIEEQLLLDGLEDNQDFHNIVAYIRPQWMVVDESVEYDSQSDKTGYYKKDMEGLFCPIPFERLFLYTTTAQLCCPWFIDYLEEGNIQEVNDLDSVWNSQVAQHHRETVLKGDFYYCNTTRCRHMLKHNLPSVDEITSPDLRKIIQERLTYIEGGPKYINIGTASSCNLWCKMCRTKNTDISYAKAESEHILKVLKNYEFKNLETIFIAGSGEVLFNEEYLWILRNMQKFKMPNLKHLILKTNGQLLHKHTELIKDLSRKYQIDISVSLDAFRKQTYQLVRRGGNYGQMMQNMELLRDMRKRGVIHRFEVTYCIQRTNFRDLLGFVDMVAALGVDDINLQKVMGEDVKESVHDNRNVYHDEYRRILDKCIWQMKRKNISLSEDSTAIY